MQKGSSSSTGEGAASALCAVQIGFSFLNAREGEGGTFQQLMSCIHTSKMTASLCDRRHAGMSPKVCQGTVAGEPE